MYQISEITSTRNITDIIDFLRQLKKKIFSHIKMLKYFLLKFFSKTFVHPLFMTELKNRVKNLV